jgi:hypothetical protein
VEKKTEKEMKGKKEKKPKVRAEAGRRQIGWRVCHLVLDRRQSYDSSYSTVFWASKVYFLLHSVMTRRFLQTNPW